METKSWILAVLELKALFTHLTYEKEMKKLYFDKPRDCLFIRLKNCPFHIHLADFFRPKKVSNPEILNISGICPKKPFQIAQPRKRGW